MDDIRDPQLWRWRVPVVFDVNAPAFADARAQVRAALSAVPHDEPGIAGPAGGITRQDREGVLFWSYRPDSYPTAHAQVRTHRAFLADLGTVALLRGLADSQANEDPQQRLLTEVELADLRLVLAATDRYIQIPDPTDPDLDPMFAGLASEAPDAVPDGLYDVKDAVGREALLIVGPSRFAPGGRSAAVFVPAAVDAQILSRVSAALQGFDRTQQPAALLERISHLVTQTGWAGINPAELQAARRGATPQQMVNVAVVTWGEDGDTEPTVLAGRNPVALARSAATLVASEFADRGAFAGGQEFLATHTDPADWRIPEDVDDWLEALEEATPLPRVTFHQLPVAGGADGHNEALARALSARAEQLDVGDPPSPELPAARGRHR